MRHVEAVAKRHDQLTAVVRQVLHQHGMLVIQPCGLPQAMQQISTLSRSTSRKTHCQHPPCCGSGSWLPPAIPCPD